VRYFLKAKIDIAWWKDPFVRAAFSVAPRCPADSIPTQIASVPQMSKGVHPSCYLPPFCCSPECACFELDCIDQGSISLQGSVDKLHGAPGELLVVNATAANRSESKVSLVVKLKCNELAWAEGHTEYNNHSMELLRLDVPPGTENFALTNRVLTVPQCPASYHGGFLVNDAWTATINQFGMRNDRYWRSRRTDPVIWWYSLIVELDIEASKFDLTRSFPFIVCSIPRMALQVAIVQAVPLPLFDAGQDQAMLGWAQQQMPLTVLNVAPLTALIDPSGAPVSSTPVKFVAAQSGAVAMSDPGEREKGIIVGVDSYTPFYPVATVEAQPDVAGVNGAPVVTAVVTAYTPIVPPEQEMQRA